MINTREIAEEYRLSHWAQITHERAESGLSIKAFCRERGLHQNRYFYWQRKLREAACKELVPAVKSRREKTETPPGWALCEAENKTQTGTSGEISIEIGRSKVSANRGCDLELLGNVCRVLMSLC
jgi:transposase-like protein